MYRDALSDKDVQRMTGYGSSWVPRDDEELVRAVEQAAFVDLRMYAQAAYDFDRKVLAFRAPAHSRQADGRTEASPPRLTSLQVRAASKRLQHWLDLFKAEPAPDGWRGPRCAVATQHFFVSLD